MDLDGTVSQNDADDFLLALSDPSAYVASRGVSPWLRGDMNLDGRLDDQDATLFERRLAGTPAVPFLIPGLQLPSPSIQFGDMDVQPASGNQDEEYITLINPQDTSVDISGWELEGGVDYTFAPGTVIPPGASLYVSPNVRAFRARSTGPSGGQRLFVQGNYSGHFSNLGETIRLRSADGALIASVRTPSVPTPAQSHLRIREIMYHPRDAEPESPFEDNDFEFIELVNISDSLAIELENIAFTRGIEFTFPRYSLAPGECVLVVRNQAAFEQRYGRDVRIAGQYGGTPLDIALSNAGETLKLEDALGNTIHEFMYRDDWYAETDGGGSSLEIIDPTRRELDLWGTREGWRPSPLRDGSPGAA
jgi:hypothetical protein